MGSGLAKIFWKSIGGFAALSLVFTAAAYGDDAPGTAPSPTPPAQQVAQPSATPASTPTPTATPASSPSPEAAPSSSPAAAPLPSPPPGGSVKLPSMLPSPLAGHMATFTATFVDGLGQKVIKQVTRQLPVPKLLHSVSRKLEQMRYDLFTHVSEAADRTIAALDEIIQEENDLRARNTPGIASDGAFDALKDVVAQIEKAKDIVDKAQKDIALKKIADPVMWSIIQKLEYDAASPAERAFYDARQKLQDGLKNHKSLTELHDLAKQFEKAASDFLKEKGEQSKNDKQAQEEFEKMKNLAEQTKAILDNPNMPALDRQTAQDMLRQAQQMEQMKAQGQDNGNKDQNQKPSDQQQKDAAQSKDGQKPQSGNQSQNQNQSQQSGGQQQDGDQQDQQDQQEQKDQQKLRQDTTRGMQDTLQQMQERQRRQEQQQKKKDALDKIKKLREQQKNLRDATQAESVKPSPDPVETQKQLEQYAQALRTEIEKAEKKDKELSKKDPPPKPVAKPKPISSYEAYSQFNFPPPPPPTPKQELADLTSRLQKNIDSMNAQDKSGQPMTEVDQQAMANELNQVYNRLLAIDAEMDLKKKKMESPDSSPAATPSPQPTTPGGP
jgi:hypothetical protein